MSWQTLGIRRSPVFKKRDASLGVRRGLGDADRRGLGEEGEIRIEHYPRRFGSSKYGLERVLKVVFDLMVVKFLARYAQKPMYVFGSAGVLSLVVAFLSGVWALYLKLFEQTSFVQTPLPLLVVMAAITGIMCFLMGLLAELVMRTYYESQGKATYLVSETRNIDTD